MAKSDFKWHIPIRVRWPEVDSQNIIYNGTYMVWTDVAQVEYFRYLNLGIYKLAEMDYFEIVVGKITLEFKSPGGLDDLLDAYFRTSRVGNNSITQEAEFYRHGDDQLLTYVQGIYPNFDPKTRRSRPVPDELRHYINQFEETGQKPSMQDFPTLAQAYVPSSNEGMLI